MTQRLFDYWWIGVYLELACLPVGREFGYWNFDPNTILRAECFHGVQIDGAEVIYKGLVETFSDPFSFRGDFALDLRVRSGVAVGLQGTGRALLTSFGGCHSDYVDGLLFG